jgi:hypothetical protein
LARREGQTLHADAPYVLHQRFAAPVIRRHNWGQMMGKSIRNWPRQLQPLQDTDFGIIATSSTKPAPESGVICAGSRAVSKDFAISASHVHRPFRQELYF